MPVPPRQRGLEGRESADSRLASHVTPAEVHDVLSRHLLLDGFPFVLDPVKSHGSFLVDARDGTEYLDFYTFFASSPLGLNPPGLVDDPEFLSHLAVVAANKPANSDVATVELAEFAETFARVLGDPALTTSSSSRAVPSRSRTPSRSPSTGSRAATRRPAARRTSGRR